MKWDFDGPRRGEDIKAVQDLACSGSDGKPHVAQWFPSCMGEGKGFLLCAKLSCPVIGCARLYEKVQ